MRRSPARLLGVASIAALGLLPATTAAAEPAHAAAKRPAVTAKAKAKAKARSTANAILTLTPAYGPRGAKVTVRGSNFPRSYSGWVKFDGTRVLNVRTSSSGSFGATFTVPSSARIGAVEVLASVGTRRDSATFSVRSSTEPAPVATPAPMPTPTPSPIASPAPTPAPMPAAPVATPEPVAATAKPAPAAPLWEGGYETGDFREWSGVQAPAQRQPTIVSSPVRDGRHAARFELQPDDATDTGGYVSHRSEVYRGSHHLPFREGDVRWFGFSLMLGSTFGSGWGNGNQTVIQWKNDGTGSAPVDMRILEDGRLAITDRRVYRTPKVYWSTPGPARTLAWHDFEVGIRFSSDPGVGFIEVRYNGVDQTVLGGGRRVHSDTLKSGYASYLKQGYYSGTDMHFAGVVYHDAMRVGTTRDQVALR